MPFFFLFFLMLIIQNSILGLGLYMLLCNDIIRLLFTTESLLGNKTLG